MTIITKNGQTAAESIMDANTLIHVHPSRESRTAAYFVDYDHLENELPVYTALLLTRHKH